MKYLPFIFLSLFLSSCSSTPLTPQQEQDRQFIECIKQECVGIEGINSAYCIIGCEIIINPEKYKEPK